MERSPELGVTLVPVSELHEHDGNAKLHPSSQVEQIAASIEEFNFADPIGAWHDEDGRAVVVEGHGRLIAARMLGIERLPVIFLDHLSDEQRRAYALVHNKTTMSTGFDVESLNWELDSIETIDMGRYDFAVSDAGLDDIFGGDELSDDTYEEPDKETLTCPSCGHVDLRERFMRA